jgi:hypothetical protein
MENTNNRKKEREKKPKLSKIQAFRGEKGENPLSYFTKNKQKT